MLFLFKKVVSCSGSVRRRIAVKNLLAVILFILSVPVYSQVRFDNSFGIDGIVKTNIGVLHSEIYKTVQQPDGKKVMVGTSEGDFLIIRINVDASLDNSFGVNGKVIIPVVNKTDVAYAVAIQNDGKIVVGGNAMSATNDYDFAIIRLKTDGTLDSSFNQTGKLIKAVSTEDAKSDIIKDIEIQSDQKIVVMGNSSKNKTVVMRLNTNGSLDNTFDGDGLATIMYDITFEQTMNDMVLLGDSIIFMGGKIGKGCAFINLKSDGSINNKFGTNGILIKNIAPEQSVINRMTVTSNGKIIAAGNKIAASVSNLNVLAFRFKANCTFDSSFSGDGILETYIRNNSYARDFGISVAVQNDGKIVFGCISRDLVNHNLEFAALRLISDGTLDNSFDGDGRVNHTFLFDANSCFIETNGKITFAGYSQIGNIKHAAVAQLNSDGSLNSSFGKSGRIIYRTGNRSDQSFSSATYPDGKILLSGFTYEDANKITIAKYNVNGLLDETYCEEGNLIMQFPGEIINIRTIDIQSDDKVVLGGFIPGTSNTKGITMRFHANGKLDSSYGNNGTYRLLHATDQKLVITRSALLSDGKILYGGTASISGTPRPSLFRFTTSGKPDSTFDKEGIAIAPGDDNFACNAMALYPADKILLAGARINGVKSTAEIVRFHSNGNIDSTFNSTGKLLFNYAGYENSSILSLFVYPDGKILVAGYSKSSTYGNEFAIARLNSNGTFDPTFGSSGKVIINVSNLDDMASQLYVLSDGKILLAGNAKGASEFAIVKLQSNGTLDNTLDYTGKWISHLGLKDLTITDSHFHENDSTLLYTGFFANGIATDFILAKIKLSDYVTSIIDFQISENTSDVLVYPNPSAGDEFYIRNNGKSVEYALLKDWSGREVSGQTFVNNTDSPTLKTEGLNEGIYFLEIRFSSGESVVRKVVVKK